MVEVLPYGREQWHVHDALLGMIRRAHAPVLPDDQRREVDGLIAAVRKKMPDDALIREPVSIGVAHVRAEPVEGAPWKHEARVLLQRPFGGFPDDQEITPEKPHVITADPVTGELDIR